MGRKRIGENKETAAINRFGMKLLQQAL